jgi:hypothetical protein
LSGQNKEIKILDWLIQPRQGKSSTDSLAKANKFSIDSFAKANKFSIDSFAKANKLDARFRLP